MMINVNHRITLVGAGLHFIEDDVRTLSSKQKMMKMNKQKLLEGRRMHGMPVFFRKTVYTICNVV